MFFTNLLTGFELLFTPLGMGMLILGVVLGIFIGAVPGMSPSMGVALLIPISFGMDPTFAFILFVSAYQAANYGGSITAIAVNAPGTPSSVVTAIDGYELTKQGRAREALNTAVISSAFGGIVGVILLIVFSASIAKIALKFGPAEYFALAFFGLSTVVAFAGSNALKAIVGVLLGLLVNSIRLDSFTGDERFTFGIIELYDGISFLPAMIGLFALGEIFYQLESYNSEKTKFLSLNKTKSLISNFFNSKLTLVKSSLIGTFVGVIPGAGATVASFISYGEVKRCSKQKDKFGKGSLEGIMASEAANSSSVGGALVPLLALGIPGSATDAVLLGALTLHGLVPGPELFQTNVSLVYGIFAAVLFANILIIFFGLLGNSLWLQVLKIPKSIIYTLIITLCFIGSYTVQNSLFDAWVCFAFGILGWFLKKYKIPSATVVLGLVLGQMLETNFRRSLIISGYSGFLTKPICLIFLILSLFSLIIPVFSKKT